MNKKLHKGCQTPRHYLRLRGFLSCRLGKIWEDIVRNHYSFLDYAPLSFVILLFKYLLVALLGHWMLS